MENEKIKNNYKLAKNDINQYIKKLRIESLQIKNKAKEYLKENKREKAKSQLIRRKRFNSQIIDSINLLKYFKGQIIKGLEIKKKNNIKVNKIIKVNRGNFNIKNKI
jgi:hypothetical protein